MVSLYWRVVAINAGGLVAAVLLLALTPATVSSRLTLAEAVVLGIGTAAFIVVNVVLLRRVFGPLERLTALMRRVDPLAPGRRIELERPVAEVAELYHSFNGMLDRLEEERRTSGRRALMARSASASAFPASSTTRSARRSPASCCNSRGCTGRRHPSWPSRSRSFRRPPARASRKYARSCAACGRRRWMHSPAQRARVARRGRHRAHGRARRARLAPELPPLAPEQDLAVYRVAQESLTNVARHAKAGNADLILERGDGGVVLRVRDDGHGIRDAEAGGQGLGLGGMRERALLVGGRLDVHRREHGGTEVRLEVPLR